MNRFELDSSWWGELELQHRHGDSVRPCGSYGGDCRRERRIVARPWTAIRFQRFGRRVAEWSEVGECGCWCGRIWGEVARHERRGESEPPCSLSVLEPLSFSLGRQVCGIFFFRNLYISLLRFRIIRCLRVRRSRRSFLWLILAKNLLSRTDCSSAILQVCNVFGCFFFSFSFFFPFVCWKIVVSVRYSIK